MSAHAHAVSVNISHRIYSVNGSFGIGNKLRNKTVIGFGIAFAHNRKIGIVQNNVSACYPINRRAVMGINKSVGIGRALSGTALAFVLSGISPQKHRKFFLFLPVVICRKV